MESTVRVRGTKKRKPKQAVVQAGINVAVLSDIVGLKNLTNSLRKAAFYIGTTF